MRVLLAVALAAFLSTGADAQVVFSDNFDDAGGAGRWSDPIVDNEFGAQDGSVDYAFDYAAAGIPPAPNGGGGIGVQFIANPTDNSTGDEGEALGIISDLASMPSGPFVLSADVYYNVDAGAESVATQYVTLGAFASGANFPADPGVNDDAPFRFGLSDGDGLAWQVTGDGGSATDVVRYQDAGNADAGSQSNILSLDDLPFGTIPGVTTGGGNPNDPFEQFGFQNRWVELTITQTADILSYEINGVEINSILNGGVFSGGSIMIGLTDAFNSAAGDAVFTVFDNVTITVPEPTSAVLGLVAMAGLAARRRR